MTFPLTDSTFPLGATEYPRIRVTDLALDLTLTSQAVVCNFVITVASTVTNNSQSKRINRRDIDRHDLEGLL